MTKTKKKSFLFMFYQDQTILLPPQWRTGHLNSIFFLFFYGNYYALLRILLPKLALLEKGVFCFLIILGTQYRQQTLINKFILRSTIFLSLHTSVCLGQTRKRQTPQTQQSLISLKNFHQIWLFPPNFNLWRFKLEITSKISSS